MSEWSRAEAGNVAFPIIIKRLLDPGHAGTPLLVFIALLAVHVCTTNLVARADKWQSARAKACSIRQLLSCLGSFGLQVTLAFSLWMDALHFSSFLIQRTTRFTCFFELIPAIYLNSLSFKFTYYTLRSFCYTLRRQKKVSECYYTDRHARCS